MRGELEAMAGGAPMMVSFESATQLAPPAEPHMRLPKSPFLYSRVVDIEPAPHFMHTRMQSGRLPIDPKNVFVI